ncbi:MAG: ABC transporter ATP-binding protein [Rhodoferax sp.]|nr:ABC transporter ATP-binding protein [Rhodoferax sp.]
MTLLTVRNLSVQFGPPDKPIAAVSNANFTVERGQIVGVVGESGSGKSTMCTALMRTLPTTARISGDISFDGKELLSLSPAQMREIRGSDLAMILQNPMTSLDPLFTIGDQALEVLRLPRPGVKSTESDAIDLLRKVRITAPEIRVRQYPHQMSGGMKQRILTAFATAANPKLLIADEPTTALDATVQEEILSLFWEIRKASNAAIIIVTHDLSIVHRLSDRTIVMYAGRIVESGPTHEVFASPRHPYTRGLIASMPRVVNGMVELNSIQGQVPRLDQLGPGCAFADRCVHATDICRQELPVPQVVGEGHSVVCWQAAAVAALPQTSAALAA